MADNVIRTISFRGTSEGLDELLNKVKALAAAEKDLALVSDDLSKRQISLAAAWKNTGLRLDENARNLDTYNRLVKQSEGLLKQQGITAEQHADRVKLLSERYGQATTAAAKMNTGISATTQNAAALTKQSSRQGAEMLNLGRQFADVGVSLQAGQSLLTVAVQQGAQIVDVFASSGRSVGQIFSSAVGWAGRFAASTAGVITGLAGIAAGVLYLASSWASAQREIDKALIGPGAASGMTKADINRIAEQAGGQSGMSVDEAREAATIFAKTGQIYQENAARATKATRELALAMGGSTAEAAKTLAEAMLDPSKGALDLSKQFGGLDATTLNYIRTLQSHNDLQGAAKVMLDAFSEFIKKQADQIGVWAQGWNEVTKRAGLFSEVLKEVVLGLAQVAEQATGVELGGFTEEQQLGRAKDKQQGAQQALGRAEELGLGVRSMEALRKAAAEATAEVARLEEKMFGLGVAAQEARLEQLSLQADKFTQAIIPSIAEAEKLTAQLWKLEEVKAAGLSSPAMEAATLAMERQLNAALQTTAALQGQANVVTLLAERYPGMTIEMARQQAILDGELGTIRAMAQAEADIEMYLVRIEQLRRQGLTLEEAELKVGQERADTEDKIAKSKDRQNELGTVAANNYRDTNTSASNAAGAASDLSSATANAANAAGRFAGNMQQVHLAANQTLSVLGNIITWLPEWSTVGGDKTIAEAVESRMDMLPTQFEGTKGTFTWDPLGEVQDKEAAERTAQRTGGRVVEKKHGLPGFGEYSSFEVEGGKSLTERIMDNQKAFMERYGASTDKNTEAIKQNTAATQTMTDVLSPFYSSDPRRTHLGYRAFALGGIMTAHGELPLKHYQGGGVASSPQVAVYGEGSSPEAYVPVPSGRIPVEIKQPANSNQRPIYVMINVRGNADGNTVSALKSTAYQQAQAMRRAMR